MFFTFLGPTASLDRFKFCFDSLNGVQDGAIVCPHVKNASKVGVFTKVVHYKFDRIRLVFRNVKVYYSTHFGSVSSRLEMYSSTERSYVNVVAGVFW